MRRLATIIPLIALLSCRVEPEPLNYGKDACFTCKMTLVDTKFGAELITGKGKVYKFDDLNCLLSVYLSGYASSDTTVQLLVVDFDRPENLISARGAYYVRSPEVRSPMGSQLAAFSSAGQVVEHNRAWKGEELRWEQLTGISGK